MRYFWTQYTLDRLIVSLLFVHCSYLSFLSVSIPPFILPFLVVRVYCPHGLNCQQSGISDLVTFAQGLEKEGSALHAAFTLPYSNGPVEGKINKLKYIKRSMYGRSGFPLLRQKVLKAA